MSDDASDELERLFQRWAWGHGDESGDPEVKAAIVRMDAVDAARAAFSAGFRLAQQQHSDHARKDPP